MFVPFYDMTLLLVNREVHLRPKGPTGSGPLDVFVKNLRQERIRVHVEIRAKNHRRPEHDRTKCDVVLPTD